MSEEIKDIAEEVEATPELSDDDAIERALKRIEIEGGSRLPDFDAADSTVLAPQEFQSSAVVIEEDPETAMREFDMPVPGIFGAGTTDREFDRKKYAKWLLILGFLALALAALLTYVFAFSQTEIPDLVGKTLPEAVSTIDEAGLKLGEISEQENASAPEGVVLDMSPLAGTKTKRGAKVSLSVSKAGSSARVPKLEGLTEDKAREMLLSNRLEVEVLPSYSDSVEAGEIIAQLPAANTQVPVASKVSVLISQGGFSNPVFAPRLIGLGLEAAENLLAEQGIRSSVVFASTSYGNVNEVVAQTPGSRELIEPGGTMLLVVGRVTAAQDAAVPEVKGLSEGAAIRAIKDAGFKPELSYMPSASVELDTVIAQNPPSEDVLMKKGEAITLLISSGDKREGRVPTLIGKTKAQAIESIQKAGFNPILVGTDLETDKGAPITQQYPQANAEYRIGMSVLIFANYSK